MVLTGKNIRLVVLASLMHCKTTFCLPSKCLTSKTNLLNQILLLSCPLVFMYWCRHYLKLNPNNLRHVLPFIYAFSLPNSQPPFSRPKSNKTSSEKCSLSSPAGYSTLLFRSSKIFSEYSSLPHYPWFQLQQSVAVQNIKFPQPATQRHS